MPLIHFIYRNPAPTISVPWQTTPIGPSVTFSTDGMTATNNNNTVVGVPVIIGKRYWEMEVAASSGAFWAIGVARSNMNRSTFLSNGTSLGIASGQVCRYNLGWYGGSGEYSYPDVSGQWLNLGKTIYGFAMDVAAGKLVITIAASKYIIATFNLGTTTAVWYPAAGGQSIGSYKAMFDASQINLAHVPAGYTAGLY